MKNSDHKHRNNLHKYVEHVTESHKHLAVSVHSVSSGNKLQARKTQLQAITAAHRLPANMCFLLSSNDSRGNGV